MDYNTSVLEKEKQLAAIEAVTYIQDQQTIGLGTGSTADYAIREIGALVQKGLTIKAVPTSHKSQLLAESFNIPIIDSNSVDYIDITIDGADEFNEDFVLIKGGGGSLLREKIVASITKKQIIIADSSKQVAQLGKEFRLPIEVIPFAYNSVKHQVEKLGATCLLRQREGKTFVTDESNWIIDADFGHIKDPYTLADSLDQLIGLVCHGLFINLTDILIVGTGSMSRTIFTTKANSHT